MEISKKQIEFYNNKINKIGKLQKIRNRQAFKIEKGKNSSSYICTTLCRTNKKWKN